MSALTATKEQPRCPRLIDQGLGGFCQRLFYKSCRACDADVGDQIVLGEFSARCTLRAYRELATGDDRIPKIFQRGRMGK